MSDDASRGVQSRRVFLGTTSSCAAHLALAASFAPAALRAAWTAPTIRTASHRSLADAFGVDALSQRSREWRRRLRRERTTVYVPGHGAVSDAPAYDRYIAMRGELETAARAAFANGTPAPDAGKSFTLPVSLGEWTVFGPTFYERAFTAWNRELGATR